mmetsp:Transcript_13446/g.22895  ORF Transcript_13446/g.22895 Transcript_13446/m.22895 type:complete len:212 (-) Transcript_13446:393-1028(-)
MSSSPTILGIAGGTGAGKTTLAREIYSLLGSDDFVTYLVHDDYYKDLSHKSMEERAQNNFDHPASLDTDLLVSHIRTLKAGGSVEVPTYDFSTHTRTTKTVTKVAKPIILVEGILLFTHPQLVDELDIKVFVDCDSDVRLSRRITRDTVERGRSVEAIIEQYHNTVRPMHLEYVEPSKRRADLIVHSTGHSMDVAIKMLINHLRVEAGLNK